MLAAVTAVAEKAGLQQTSQTAVQLFSLSQGSWISALLLSSARDLCLLIMSVGAQILRGTCLGRRLK